MYSKTKTHSPLAGQSGCKLLSFKPILWEFNCAKAEWDGFIEDKHETSHDCLHQRTVPVSTCSSVKTWGWSYSSRKLLKLLFPAQWPAFSRKCLYVEAEQILAQMLHWECEFGDEMKALCLLRKSSNSETDAKVASASNSCQWYRGGNLLYSEGQAI